MKNIRTILFAALAFVAAMSVSCSKEDNAQVQENEERGAISVSVNGMLGEFAQSEGTKSGMINTVRVKWSAGDKVYAYDAEKPLGTLIVSLKDGKDYFAVLSGEITAPAGNKIFLVHGNALAEAPKIENGKIAVDLPEQASEKGDYSEAPFVTYGTMECSEGQTIISNQIVDFNFASSIMRFNCTGLEKSTAVASAKLTGFSNQCVIDLSKGMANVADGNQGDINFSFTNLNTSANGAVVFYASMAKNAKAEEQTLEVPQTKTYEWSFGTRTREAGQSINAICQLTEKVIPPYVVIAGLKWARQNLAISESGKKTWKPGGSAVKVPGSDEDVINGDYFQWAAYENYALPVNDFGEGKTDKGLLIYTSFTSTGCGDDSDAFKLKDGKSFAIANTPYYDGSAYTKYNAVDSKVTLETTDDVASIILGGKWRMPTQAEFEAMYRATKWTWDSTDEGCYVTEKGVKLATDKSNALLFFPATGGDTALLYVGELGNYWMSSLNSSKTTQAFNFQFQASGYNPKRSLTRYLGFTVRPVSD